MIGFLGLWGNLPLLVSSRDFINLGLAIIGIGVSAAFIYFSFALRKLLVKSPQIVKGVIIAAVVSQLIPLLLTILAGQSNLAIYVRSIFAIGIGKYLEYNVNRLSQPLKEQNSAPSNSI